MKLNKKTIVIRRRVFPCDNFWEVFIGDVGVSVSKRHVLHEARPLEFYLIYLRKIIIFEVLLEAE